MGKLNATILAKIKLAVASQQTPIPASNVELPQAMRYIEALLSDTTDLEILEKSLIRFFRIRPKQYNNTSSSISSIYSMLKTANILPEAPQTAEEKLLSEFLVTLFTQPIAKKKNGVYTALSPTEPETNDTVSIYKTVSNIEASNNELSQYASIFNWDSASMIYGNTRLHDAVGIKDVALVTLLLAAGANMNALNRSKVSPLDNALSSDNDDIILQFITCPQITSSGNNENIVSMVFIDAIKKGKYNLIAAMLSTDKIDRKTFLNTADADGTTPLHWAATMGNITIVKLLIDNGANANTTNNSKNTPLSTVAGRSKDNKKPDHLAIASMLLGAMTPAFINAETQNGLTALGWAFDNGNKDIVQLLIDNGANANVENLNSNTPLSLVAERNEDNSTDATDALNAKRVKTWLVRNDMDTLDNQVRDLSLTVLEQKEEIETLHKIIKELKARIPADSASSSVATTVRLSLEPPAGNDAGRRFTATHTQN